MNTASAAAPAHGPKERCTPPLSESQFLKRTAEVRKRSPCGRASGDVGAGYEAAPVGARVDLRQPASRGTAASPGVAGDHRCSFEPGGGWGGSWV